MNKIETARTATFIGYFGLLALIAFWAINPTTLKESSTSFVLLLGGLPLLLGLYGILKQKPYTHAWICIISLLYMIHGVVEVWSAPDNRIFASLEILLSACLYLGAGFYARYRSRELKKLIEENETTAD